MNIRIVHSTRYILFWITINSRWQWHVFYLAKTEECGRKLNRVICESWRLKNLSAKQEAKCGKLYSELGNEKIDNVDKHVYLNEKSEEFIQIKEKILMLERVVLHIIGFQLSIDHPYKLIVTQVRMSSSRVWYCFILCNYHCCHMHYLRFSKKQLSYILISDYTMSTIMCHRFASLNNKIKHSSIYIAHNVHAPF